MNPCSFDEICQVTAFACDFQYRAVCPVLIVYIFSLSSIVIVFRILPEILISCFQWSLNDPIMLFVTLCYLSSVLLMYLFMLSRLFNKSYYLFGVACSCLSWGKTN